MPLRSPAVTGKKAMLNAMGNETGGLGDEDARAFVRKFGLRNYDEWREYAKSGDKPHIFHMTRTTHTRRRRRTR